MQKNNDSTKTVGYIDIRVFAHATEDATKVQTAVKNLLTPELADTVVFEQTSLEGHHRNSITVFTAKLTDEKQLPLTVQKIGQGLSALDREALGNDVQLHLEKCNLYLRFDKQSAFCGNFKFTQTDPIHLKIHFKDKTQDEIIDFSRQIGFLAMTRAFTDLHLRVNPKDPQATTRAIAKAAKLGYRAISIPFTQPPPPDQLNQFKTQCDQSGLDFVVRADFKPHNQEDLMRFLRKFRRKARSHLHSLRHKEIAQKRAKDHRVDLINFPSLDYHKRFFDRAEAELAVSNLAAMEVDVKSLAGLGGSATCKVAVMLRREVALAKEFHVPLVFQAAFPRSI